MPEIPLISEFFASPAGNAVILVVLMAVADLAFGVYAALRDNVFELDALSAWVRVHLWGKVAPILSVLLLGAATGGLTLNDGVSGILSAGGVLTGVGILAATTYILSVIASIKESFEPKPEVREVPVE